MSDVREKIREILAEELELELSEVTDETDITSLDMDSLTFIQLFTEFQEQFEIDISIHDLSFQEQQAQLKTVGDLMSFIESHM